MIMAKVTKKPASRPTGRAAPAKKAAKPAPKTKAKTPAAKKTAVKKTTARTSLKTPKKAPARAQKAPSPRTRTTAKPAANKTAAKQVTAKFPTDYGKLLTRRPPNNPELPAETIDQTLAMLTSIRDEMENYSAHLRALDRKRLNGVGVKKLGFIGRALQLAAENPEFLPHWLSLEKFQDDNNYYLALRSVYDVIDQLKEIQWNIVLQASDVVYTDALEYYSQVGDAAKRRIDPAETLHKDLSTHFKKMGSKPESEPTEKKAKRDFDALLHGKKDGKIVVENIKPKLTGGSHKVIDETWKDDARFKESEEGEMDE
jgi:hypothetical protein